MRLFHIQNLEQQPYHEWIRGGRDLANRQGRIVVSAVGEVGLDEQLTRHGGHRVQDALVANLAAQDPHPVAPCTGVGVIHRVFFPRASGVTRTAVEGLPMLTEVPALTTLEAIDRP
jgi:hypothetical protein